MKFDIQWDQREYLFRPRLFNNTPSIGFRESTRILQAKEVLIVPAFVKSELRLSQYMEKANEI